jgi:hypothetical protein
MFVSTGIGKCEDVADVSTDELSVKEHATDDLMR